MNFSRDIVDSKPQHQPALVVIDSSGNRSELNFGQVADLSNRMAGTLQAHGIGKGDVVITLIGNRPEWVFAMVGCLRIGAIALPCNEQLRPKDIALRISTTNAKLIVTDTRNMATVQAASPSCDVLTVPDQEHFSSKPAPAVELATDDPALIIFTSGTAGEPKAVVHGQRYLLGQQLQATNWFAPQPGELAWCTAASGWSKSARNVFVAPWLRDACALLHDGRFDPEQRLQLIESEKVNRLCMSPTEYRLIAKHAKLRPLPSIRGLVAAGEALNPEIITLWERATSHTIHDGYGQTETGQITAPPQGGEVRPGSMGKPLPGIKVSIEGGELVLDPATVPTFFLGYLGEPAPTGPWYTGDLVEQDDDGYLYFQGRNDDVIVSAGYRIGPFEVESALISHSAVAEAAVVAANDQERGSIVKAFVVLREGQSPTNELKEELQSHVKTETAPYKYPRQIEFIHQLPKTSSGKIKRAQLREISS